MTYLRQTLWRTGTLGACAMLGALLLSSSSASASVVFYSFNDVFNGATPAGSSPWVTATFTDLSTPGKVQLTITDPGLTGNEFLGSLFLNLDPADKPSSLKFTEVGSTGTFSAPKISTGEDKFKANGDGKYDILFSFSQKPAAATAFGVGDSVTFDITSTSTTLTASDFAFLSTATCGTSPFLAAAEVEGIPTSCATTTADGWVAPNGLTAVPEPSASLLLALAAGLCLGVRWLSRRTMRA